VYKICAKHIIGGNIYVRSKISCVRSSHNLCARAQAHSLEGTLFPADTVTTWDQRGYERARENKVRIN